MRKAFSPPKNVTLKQGKHSVQQSCAVQAYRPGYAAELLGVQVIRRQLVLQMQNYDPGT